MSGINSCIKSIKQQILFFFKFIIFEEMDYSVETIIFIRLRNFIWTHTTTTTAKDHKKLLIVGFSDIKHNLP